MMKSQSLEDIAEGMSIVACSEEWFAVYCYPLTADGPQFDQIHAVFRDPDDAQDCLLELSKTTALRGEVRTLMVNLPVYVKSAHPRRAPERSTR